MKDARLIEIEKIHNDKFTIMTNDYENLRKKVQVKCNICGHVWETDCRVLKYYGNCPECIKKTKEEEGYKKFFEEFTDEGKRLCEEKGYIFLSVNKGKHNTWYITYDVNRNKRNGEKYDVITQELFNFRNGKLTKELIGETLSYTTEEWVEKAKKVHPEYIYDKVSYVNNRKSIIVTCPIHGDFSVMPKVFMKKDYKCAKCKVVEKHRKRCEESIKEATEMYNGKYTYDASSYVTFKDKMKMFCPEHGEFQQSMYNHLKGMKCPKCSYIESASLRRLTNEEFIERANKIHNGKYDYSKLEYVNYSTPVCVICPIHGEFYITPGVHLNGGGCKKCKHTEKTTLETFIESAKKVHGNKYDYSEVEYKGVHKRVGIICREKDEFGEEHGKFWQIAKNHTFGYGCPKCGGKIMSYDYFVKKGNLIHDNKYDYSRVHYISSKTKVDIVCPEHGVFMMTPDCHVNRKQGCPLCKESHLEREIRMFLTKNNIEFVTQQRFEWLRNDLTKYTLPLDFYLPEYNVAIECQGEQHYVANFYKSKGIEYAQEHLKGVQERDNAKKIKCKENGVQLIYFTETYLLKYLENEVTPYFTNTDDLLSFLENIKK